ncbi:MAG: SDR family oxidoreductase [Gemmatimonadaceae bacterium]|nr:SDR family oxidoreductase [Gemmatimonadaceae bacterium]MCW5825502.1 SDR family oxidoreductase [Gemmatimonadaceae bacterium]
MAATTRVALVTGAGQRVGRAIAAALAEDGWAIAAHYRQSREGAEELVASIRAQGGEAEAFGADLSDPAACEQLVNDAYDRFEGLTLLVNSAAGMQKTRLGHTTAAEFDAIVGLNLRAPFLLAQAAARLMPAGGCIVNIADHMAEEPWPDYSVHGIAKAGVIAMTRHLAAALAPDLRVNAIAPGFVLAPPGMPESAVQQFAEQTPLQRVGDPADVVRALRYLVSATFVTGETLFVDGGRRVRP